MTRDETIALLLQCESEGWVARNAAAASGKPCSEVDNIARRAARAHWSAWASKELAKKKALIGAGKWNDRDERKWYRKGVKGGDETLDWLETAVVDFSKCKMFMSGEQVVIQYEHQTEANKTISLDFFNGFGGLAFPGMVIFDQSEIDFDISFENTVFHHNASFREVIFRRTAAFQESKFGKQANFESAKFWGEGNFRWTTFLKGAYFSKATFSKQADFYYAEVYGDANFTEAKFSGDALFSSSIFFEGIYFYRANFAGLVDFNHTQISGNAEFEGRTFGEVFFNNAKFGSKGKTNFRLVNFGRAAEFNGAIFEGETSFNAVRGGQAFSMAGTRFERVPDFIQAHLEEAPRLDNLRVIARTIPLHPQPKRAETNSWWRMGWRSILHMGGRIRTWPVRAFAGARLCILSGVQPDGEARNVSARWRAIKRLAIQGHDTDRELEFHVRELRSQRFAGHWPLPVEIWRRRAWGGFFGFWFVIGYELFSDFGRSVFRPFFFWLICILAAAAFYLSQTDVLQRDLFLQNAWWGSAAIQAGRYALSNTVPCSNPTVATTNETTVGGLSEKLRGQTNARAEALHLAFRNAFVVLDGGSDASHRMYGCLYGLEMYAGQNPVPIVPSAVSTASAIQKLISGVLIFLFGLALRNMLKVK